MSKTNALRFQSAFATYTAESLIGQGGAGRVYRATSGDAEVVAVKVLAPADLSQERLKRFKNETLFGSRTRHPGIVPVIDHGVASLNGVSVPFLVMPHYPETLRSAIKLGLAPDRALPLFATLLDAVECAHLLDVVHRDIKPENVLLPAQGDRLCLADFGIAAFTQESLYTLVETKPNTRLANFVYAAPEQRSRGMAVGPSADLFALGLILNEMITGVVPSGTNFRRIGDVDAGLAYLDPIVDSLLCQDPAARPASVDTLKQQLIARRQQFVSRQRLDQLTKAVVPITSPSAPELQRPVVLEAFDVAGQSLLLKLNQEPSTKWIQFYRTAANVPHFLGRDPKSFHIAGRTMTIPALKHEYQGIIDSVKAALTKVAAAYPAFLENEARAAAEAEREALRKAADQERERQSLLAQLRI